MNNCESYLEFWRCCTVAVIPPIVEKLDNISLLDANGLQNEKWKSFYLSNLAMVASFCSNQSSVLTNHDNRSRTFTFRETNDSSSELRFKEDIFYGSCIFKTLVIGLMHFDQEVRLGTLSIINILLKHLEVNNISRNIICWSYIRSSVYICVSRCIDLCCSPYSFEGEVVESLKSLTFLLSSSPSVLDKTVLSIVLSTLSSTLRDANELASSDAVEIQKRKKLIDMSLGLATHDIAKSFRMYSQFSLYQKSRIDLLDVHHYPAGLLSTSCATVIIHLLEINAAFVVKYGAISGLMSFILLSHQQIAHQLLTSIICVSNFSSHKCEIFSALFRPLLEIFTYTPSDFDGTNAEKADYICKLNQSAELLRTLFASWTGFLSVVSYNSKPTRFYKSGLHFLVKVLLYGDIICRLKILQLISSLLAIDIPILNVGSKQSVEKIDSRSDINLESLNLNHVFNSASCSRFIDLRTNFRTFVFNALAEVGLIKVLKNIQNKFSDSSEKTEDDGYNHPALNTQLRLASSTMLSELCVIFMPLFPDQFSNYFNILLPTTVTDDEKKRKKSYAKDLGSFFSDVAKHNCLSGLNLERLNYRNNAVRKSSTRLSQVMLLGTEHYEGTRLSTFVLDHLRSLYNPSRSGIPKSYVNFGVHLNQLLFESRVLCQSISYNVKQTRVERNYNLAIVRTWNWPIICCILSHLNSNESSLKDCEFNTTNVYNFIRYLVLYFKPSTNFFSRETFSEFDKQNEKRQKQVGYRQSLHGKVEAGKLLFKFLATNYDNDSENFVRIGSQNTEPDETGQNENTLARNRLSATEFRTGQLANQAEILFKDFAAQLESAASPLAPSTATATFVSAFSAENLEDSLSQLYFIFIGNLSTHCRRAVLDDFNILDNFITLLLVGDNEMLCKLIITCMPYSGHLGGSECSQLLEVVTMTSESSSLRLFALSFLDTLSQCWLDASRVLPWHSHGLREFPWIVNILFDCILNKSDTETRTRSVDLLLKLSIDERMLPIIFNNQSEINTTPRHNQLFNLCREILTCANTFDEETRKTRKSLEESLEKQQLRFLGLKLACLLSRILTCPKGETKSNNGDATLTPWSSPMLTLNEYAPAPGSIDDQYDGINATYEEDYNTLNDVDRDSFVMLELCNHLLNLWLENNLCKVYSEYVDHLSLQLFAPRMFSNSDVEESPNNSIPTNKDLKASAMLPPHLFFQMSQSQRKFNSGQFHAGFEALTHLFQSSPDVLSAHLNCLMNLCPTQKDLPDVKAAVWAIASIASTEEGFEMLPRNAVILLVMQAENSSVLSMRATAMSSLSLLCDTALKFISPLGWASNLTSNTGAENPDPNDPMCNFLNFRESISGFYDASELLFEDPIAVKLICKEFVDEKLDKGEQTKDGDKTSDVHMAAESPKIDERLGRNDDEQNGEAVGDFSDDHRMSILHESVLIQSSAVCVVLPEKVKQVSNLRNPKHRNTNAPQIMIDDSNCKPYSGSADTNDSIDRKSTSSVDDAIDQSDGDTSSKLLRPAQSSDSISTFMTGSLDNLIGMSSGDAVSDIDASTTPPNRPGIITIRRNTEIKSGGSDTRQKIEGMRKRTASLRGIKFSSDSELEPTIVRNRSNSTINIFGNLKNLRKKSDTLTDPQDSVVHLSHQPETCLQCDCFYTLTRISATLEENPQALPDQIGSFEGFSTHDDAVYLPKDYREQFLHWTSHLCSLGSNTAATKMEIFMRKFVFGFLRYTRVNDTYDVIARDKYLNLERFCKVDKRLLVCLYSDCLLILNRNSCSAAARLFVHNLFQPAINEQIAKLRLPSFYIPSSDKM